MDIAYEQLWENGPLFAQAEHFKFGTDSVLLADFVREGAFRKGIDLGCASGILSLLLLNRFPNLYMTGFEIVEDACVLARRNMEINNLSDRCEVINADIRLYKEHFKTGSFDLVISNPPYFPLGSGKTSDNAGRSNARGELSCTMEDICSAAAYLCKTGGSVCFVHKPERMAELFCTMSRHGIEPKRLRMVCHKGGKAPNLILVEGRRGGKAGLTVLPQLILRNEDESETEEVQKIYHRL